MKTVLGREVNGEIHSNNVHHVEQKPGEEFLPLLDAVLGQPNVHSVRWTQYTPYFNDGEPCIFRINEASVKLVQDNPDLIANDFGYLDTYAMRDYSGGYGKSVSILPGLKNLYLALNALNSQIDHFEDFLRESFGDHAEVTALSNGFDVEFYEHD